MTGPTFVDDLPANGNSGRSTTWGPVFDALAERPGQWALVKECADHNTASLMKRGHLGGARYPAGSIEAVTRNSRVIDGKRRCDIYARYVGGEA